MGVSFAWGFEDEGTFDCEGDFDGGAGCVGEGDFEGAGGSGSGGISEARLTSEARVFSKAMAAAGGAKDSGAKLGSISKGEFGVEGDSVAEGSMTIWILRRREAHLKGFSSSRPYYCRG